MCGIFGNFCFNPGNVGNEVFRNMAEALKHRGPDASGYYSDEIAAVGNTRLSIVDLSSKSNQPFYSKDGDTVVVQNGEIYNFIELRNELKRYGWKFHTTGDTEVLLKAFEQWGPDFVNRLNGMFAIAVYQRKEKRLWLFRDRLGVKPLYYTGSLKNGKVWFASEIKALLAAGINAKPNYDALAQYLALNYIPQPDTAFDGIYHLPPAHMAEVTNAGISIQRYWDLANTSPTPDMSKSEAITGLLTNLDDATRIRMRADAKHGAFLSGGLDSSSVIGFMSMYQTDPINTYSIGFDNARFDETKFAMCASKRFGTVHNMKRMNADINLLWARFIWHVDQPHGDVSFMPIDQVSTLASQDVKMVLTGDGGDEIFAGYEKYATFFKKHNFGNLQQDWESDFVRFSGLLQDDEPENLLTGDLYQAFHGCDPYRGLSSQILKATHQDAINKVLFAETTTLLPGNNLVKPDRMGMANSLEVRSPFLDYRLVEFAFKIPGSLKLVNGETKAIYKKAIKPLLGDFLTYRKKQMFTVPVGEWLRQELADYCRSMLLDGRLESRGIVNIGTVAEMLEAHIQGHKNYTRQLRALISMEIWFRLFIDCDSDLREASMYKPELN